MGFTSLERFVGGVRFETSRTQIAANLTASCGGAGVCCRRYERFFSERVVAVRGLGLRRDSVGGSALRRLCSAESAMVGSRGRRLHGSCDGRLACSDPEHSESYGATER